VPRLTANGIEIEYDTFGEPNAAALLLIMGLGAQMISWEEEFCGQLASRGFHVIRFDNRDSGLSTKMEAAGEPDLVAAFGGNAAPAYQLDDLADDAAGLLDGLGIRAAHIVGASMGGFIAQLVAINHPDRALSLTSIMSGPGGLDGVAPEPEGAEVLATLPPPTREERIENGVWIRRVLTGAGNPFDEEAERKKVERAYDRSYYPVGTGRQLVAILAAHGRLERLARVNIPTLVVHGIDDVLVPAENGRLVAGAVPGARLLELETMGHNLPERFWPQVLDAIAENARQATVLQPS
jgi:pimeloyl-ACP methyl ester carboxylesterase